MNAELVKVGDTIIGKDGSPMTVLDVEHVYEGDGPGMNLRQILITTILVERNALRAELSVGLGDRVFTEGGLATQVVEVTEVPAGKCVSLRLLLPPELPR